MTASNGGGGIVVRATTRSRHQRIRRVIKGFVTFVLWIRCLSGDGGGGVDIWIVKYKYN